MSYLSNFIFSFSSKHITLSIHLLLLRVFSPLSSVYSLFTLFVLFNNLFRCSKCYIFVAHSANFVCFIFSFHLQIITFFLFYFIFTFLLLSFFPSLPLFSFLSAFLSSLSSFFLFRLYFFKFSFQFFHYKLCFLFLTSLFFLLDYSLPFSLANRFRSLFHPLVAPPPLKTIVLSL